MKRIKINLKGREFEAIQLGAAKSFKYGGPQSSYLEITAYIPGMLFTFKRHTHYSLNTPRTTRDYGFKVLAKGYFVLENDIK